MNINSRYEILTPEGFKDFRGVMCSGIKETWELVLDDGNTITATSQHKFLDECGSSVRVEDIESGTKLKTLEGVIEVLDKRKIGKKEVYDIVEVIDAEHQFIVQSNVVSLNCDEFAFVRPNLANEFWTSIQPVLSTGGACIITSTPKSDEDQFAQIWKGAINNTDEFGNTLPNGEGRNGFFPIKVKWDAHPERDETWAEPFRNSLGPAKFAQEFECVIGDTMLELTNANDEWQMMSIGELYEYLKNKNNANR